MRSSSRTCALSQLPKPAQPRPRLKHARSCGEHAQLSMFGKNASATASASSFLLGETYQPFLLGEVRSHA